MRFIIAKILFTFYLILQAISSATSTCKAFFSFPVLKYNLDLIRLLHSHQKVRLVQGNIYSSLYYTSGVNPTIEWIIIAFPFDVQSIAISLDYFWNLEIFLPCILLEFFFIECSSIFFTFEIIKKYFHGAAFSTFLIRKTFRNQFRV